jgi:hypothetical protein
VGLCIAKYPNDVYLARHPNSNKTYPVDYRHIYRARASWWFTPVYVPDLTEWAAKIQVLNCNPTTGFSALIDILAANPAELYLTGFDFFQSKQHELNRPWRPVLTSDPLAHQPQREFKWLRQNLGQPITLGPDMEDYLK